MSRRPDPARKPALLEQILDYLLDKPLSSLSLRPLATALGVSTFTLVYHFGSRDELLNEIVRAISQRSHPVIDEVMERPATVETYVAGLERSWEWAVQERNIRLLRLEFEAALLEAHDRGHTHTRATFMSWQKLGRDVLLDMGFSDDDAEVESRLAVDTVMGLQYDLIVHRDPEGATRSFRRFIERVRARLESALALSDRRAGG